MEIKKLLKFLSKSENDLVFKIQPDSSGINFILPENEFEKCKKLESNEWLQHQFMFLKMLVEQGNATEFPNGFNIVSDDVVNLPEIQELFDLPSCFPGKFSIYTENETTQSSFNIKLRLDYYNGTKTFHYDMLGPYLKIGDTETYLLSPVQWEVFKSINEHKKLEVNEKNEYQNLLLIYKLQQAKKAGAEIDLAQFNNLKLINPEKISVSSRISDDDSLILNPVLGTKASIEKIEKRLGQIVSHGDVQSFRIEDEIILLDEKKLLAAREIIRNRKIPKSQIKDFINTPSAFLNASLVDLDTGFSLRVKGASTFKHAYFGETDESNLNWFSKNEITSESLKFYELDKLIKDNDSLNLFKEIFKDARRLNAQEMEFEKQTIDISIPEKIENKLDEIQNNIQNSSNKKNNDLKDEEEGKIDSINTDPVVIDIETNDEKLAFGSYSPFVSNEIKAISYRGELHIEDLKRLPFPHQEEGIRWLLGLAMNKTDDNNKKKYHGGLMADDMGLGKTFMALVGIYEYYKNIDQKQKIQKPVLIVAPLSLLENWKDEIEKTFKCNPFDNIVILQSNVDLKKFKEKGSKIETKQNIELLNDKTAIENAIQYSLKIGKKYGLSRLDIPKRLVITTYQTLRDYQFSLCRIDWSFVIFDEAQNIKNPNALQTRAAKGLKAEFTLILTGTPVENHLGDFWCLVDTAHPGYLGSYQDFRKKYISPIAQANSDQIQNIRDEKGRQLRKDVGALMIRRLKEDQLEGLPKKNIYVGIEINKIEGWHYKKTLLSIMQDEQLEYYNATINNVIKNIEGINNNTVLAGLHRLRDISLHHHLVDKGNLNLPNNINKAQIYLNSSGKIGTVFNILKEIEKRNEKVILFMINKRLQRFMSIACKKIFNIEVEIINGDTPVSTRKKIDLTGTRKAIIDNFQNKNGFGILIMSPIAAGVGLTITGANNVIHVERHWNPAKEAQATDRVYRIGQERDVNIYVPILHHPELDSFDTNLHKLLFKKSNLKDAVITPEEVDLSKTNIFSTSGFEDTIVQKKDLINISWEHFEALVAEIYAKLFKAETFLTKKSQDIGCDVVVLSETDNILIQCKQTKNEMFSGEKVVRELLGAPKFYKKILGKEFKKLILVCNAKQFSKQTQLAGKMYNVKLLGFSELCDMLDKVTITHTDIFNKIDKKRI